VGAVDREKTLSSSLWIGNVSSKVREDELRSLFSPFGEIVSLKILRRSQCAFVNYSSPAAATAAKRHVQVPLPCPDTTLTTHGG
jgi:RNA recognition motif-containing protein